jgi:hypothetical protein
MDSWDPSKHRTVIKCSSCGAEVSGLEECCPMCGYEFADLASTLPALRDHPERLATDQVREQLAEGQRTLPRSVTIPVLAGLMIAVVVLVFVRVTSEHNFSSHAESQPQASAPVSVADALSQLPGEAADVGVEKAGNLVQAISGVGPAVQRVIPIDIRFPVSGLSNDHGVQDRLREKVADSDLRTCVPLAGRGGVSYAEFYFDKPMRFSHVMMHLGCEAEGRDLESVVCTLITEDGTRRRVTLQGGQRASLVDLAGALSGKISVEFEVSDVPLVGLAEVSFYAF